MRWEPPHSHIILPPAVKRGKSVSTKDMLQCVL